MTGRSASTAPTAVTRTAAMLADGLIVVSIVLVALLMVISPASAYWTAAGSAVGAGSTSTLTAPTGVTVPANSLSSVAVSWTVSAGSLTPDGYYVTRTSGGRTVAACASSPTVLRSGSSCTDTSVPDGSYTYTVTAKYRSWTAAGAPSGGVTVWTPTKVAFTGQPSSTVAGVAISPAVAVSVQNAAGVALPFSGTSVTVSLGANPGGGALSGTVSGTTNSGGVVTFAGLSMNKAGVGYTLVATSSGLTSATSASFTVTAATADRFVITSGAVSGTAASSPTLGPITVQRQDPLGNPATPASAVTVNLSSSSAGASLAATSGGSTTTSVTIASGSASTSFFYGDTAAGSPTVTVAGALASATQNETVTAGTPTKFAISSAAITAGVASATASIGPLTLQRQDSFGNPATAAGTEVVTLASNSTGTKFFSATSGGPSTTTVTIPADSSSVNFYYADTKAGGPTLTVSGALTSTTQNETIVAAAASNFKITTAALSGIASSTTGIAPTGPVIGPITVEQQDPFGNPVNASAGGTGVTLASTSAGTKVFSATSGGSTTASVTIQSGSSSVNFYYGDTLAGTPTITVSGGLTSDTQGETITAAGAFKLVFGQQPSNAVHATAIAPAVTVQIQDQYGNLTASTASVSIAIANNAGVAGQGVLSGTSPRSGVNGTATFSNLSITGTLSLPLLGNGNGYTLRVTSSGLVAVTSGSFNIT